ncbi:hypothetical protein R1flu_022448 [Riccia fluitans]|uniref:Reverse transcriptase domain-containing protein n=1 Tax=Riccia fluitans TaxID=41844 RepID=A0ABD1XS29_9MARC
MAFLKEANAQGRIKPLSFGDHAVEDFSLFADDMGVYLDLDENSFRTLRGILSFFKSASGAKLNLQKSSALVIRIHTDPPPWLRHMGCVLMEHKTLYRYLGAPIGSSLTHDQLISYCMDRLVSRLNLWSNKILSFESRFVLVKHILLTIPIFYLSTIGTTKKVAEGIEAIARHFLWGRTNEGKNKRGLIPWPALKCGKRNRGLGFKDIWRQSVALFSKHMGEYMASMDKAQWHKLLDAFIYGQRAKRCRNVIRGNYQAQEMLLMRRPLHPGKSFMAKSLISAWTLTSKDLIWSPANALIPDHLTLRDLVALTMQRDGLSNQSLKMIMSELRSRGVTTVSLLWQGKERLLTSNRHYLTSNTVNLLRRVVRAIGLASVKLQHAAGWTGKNKTPLLSFNRPASEFYKITKPDDDWTKEINSKWELKDKYWKAMQNDKLLPFGSSLRIFSLPLLAFIDDTLGPMPSSVAKWKVFIELWRNFWMNRNKLVFEGLGCDTTVWLCTRQALDKCILNWWDEKKHDANNFAMQTVLELLSHIPKGKFSALHQKIIEK